MKRKNQDRRIAGTIIAVWVIALLFGVLIYKGKGLGLDYTILDLFKGWLTPARTSVMKAITFTGDAKFYIGLMLLLVFVLFPKKEIRSWILLAAALLIAFGLNEGLKAIFQRIRPEGIALIKQGGYSFPSGHSMVAASFYPVAAWLIERKHKSLGIVSTLLFIYAFIPGFSRLYLGVHYPSDVFFGHLLGLSIGYICIRVYLFFERKDPEKKRRKGIRKTTSKP